MLHKYVAVLFAGILFCQPSFAQVNTVSDAVTATFLKAQEAARSNDFTAVASILSDLLENHQMNDEYRLRALSNRGVAYTHMEQFDLALADLLAAVDISPEHPLSRNQLGIIAEYHAGEYEEAAIWYRVAAEQGYAPSQTNLAALYAQGKGVQKSERMAFELYASAILQGYPLALTPMAEIHFDESSQFFNPEMGLEFLLKAVEYSDAAAHYLLGQMYESGQHVEANAETAFLHYQNAAEAGNAEAQNWLGYRFRIGLGVPRDITAAAAWYERAVQQGHYQAKTRLAWLLATCPNESVCDGERALQLALEMVETEGSAIALDTAAAAYARTGDFEMAVTTLERALQIRSSAAYLARLEQYKQGTPHSIR